VCAVPMGMMAAGDQRTDGDALAAWAEGLASRREGVRGRGCLRFAFYGRVSTEDWQDPVMSRARQLQQAVMLTAGRGVIVADFFDKGQSRSPPYGYRLGDAGPHPNKAHAAWDAARTSWNLTRPPRRSSRGCSRSDWPGTAPPGSPAL